MHPDYLDCPERGQRQGLSQQQLSEWLAFYNADPWGEERSDWRNAISTSVLFNLHKAKNCPPLKVKDLLYHQPPVRPQTAEEMRRVGMRLATRIIKKNGDNR